MPSTTVKVGSSIGLHARPAGLIAAAATETGVPVTLTVAGAEPVDAGSALLIMTLGAKLGDEVTVTSGSEDAVDKISTLVASDLDA